MLKSIVSTMLKQLLCLCLVGIVPIFAFQQTGNYKYLLYKLYPRNEGDVEFLKQVVAGNSSEYRYANGESPKIVTPLSQGKTAYAFVPQSSQAKFLNQSIEQHLKAVLVEFTTVEQLSVNKQVNSRQTFPQSPRANFLIESPRVTNWGAWGVWGECQPGDFVVGMRLKTEQSQGAGDDTALNAIRLLCASPGSHDFKEISSLEGEWGVFGRTFYCPEGYQVNGFELRSEKSQGLGDDTAANNLRIVCSDLATGVSTTIEGDGAGWGDWTGVQKCLSQQSVCGLRTQVEPSLGAGDDTALNNVDMVCCDLKPTPYMPPGGPRGVPPGLIASILATAKEYSAPFITTALQRLHAGIFGSDRAARSFDVTIYNTLDKTYQMTYNKCEESGGWSSTLLPEFKIPPHQSIAYGAESHGFMTGATGCRVDYKATDGSSSFWVRVSNPYIGKVSHDKSTTSNLKIMAIVGNGNNNEGRFIVYV